MAGAGPVRRNGTCAASGAALLALDCVDKVANPRRGPAHEVLAPLQQQRPLGEVFLCEPAGPTPQGRPRPGERAFGTAGWPLANNDG